MKKTIILVLMLFTILTIAGCFDGSQPLTDSHDNLSIEWNSIKDDFEDVIQEIQIYSAGGELLFTITDNKEIFIFIKNLELDKWDYSLKEIPPAALKLCTYVGRLEQDGQMVTQAVNTVYHDQNGYYHLSESPGGITQNKMSDQAAHYLIELAGLELSGTEKFSDHEFFIFSGDN